MVAYTIKQKLFILKSFYQNNSSVEKVKNAFNGEFKKTKLPTDSFIVGIVKLFEEFGSVITKHTENKINGQSTHSLEDEDTVNNIKCEDIQEKEECQILREKDCIEIKTEPQTLFQTDVKDSLFLSDTENRIATNENSLSNDHFAPNNVSSDTDDDDLKPLINIRSQRKLNESVTDAEPLKLTDLNDKNYKPNELGSAINHITLTDGGNSDDIKYNSAQKTKLKSKTRVRKPYRLKSKKIFKCEECNKEFKGKRDYTIHIKHHKAPCEICGKTYAYLKQHMKRHALEKPFKCNECGTGFINMGALETHLTTHTNERPFECEVCKKTFKHIYSLRMHIKIHSQDRSFKCEICGKGFQNNINLKLHVRRHTGEKPYVCSFCGKSFVAQTDLTSHVRIHTGEKPFKCNICDRQFNALSTLVVHKRLHTGETPYKCSFCEKSFTSNSTQKMHERTHTGDYRFKCALCGKAHLHQLNLKSHMRHAHRENQS